MGGLSKKEIAFQSMWVSQSQRMAIMKRIFRYAKLQPNGCIEWQGYKSETGYGRMTVNKVPMRVHRLSWCFANGKEAGNLLVCHKCDNPSCVNPEHLFLGTHLENMRDCIAKNRLRRCTGHTRNRGALNPKAVLTENDVRRIRAIYADGTISIQAISDMYAVHRTTISDIVNNVTWKELS